MEWVGAKYRLFSDDSMQDLAFLDHEAGEKVEWSAEFSKPHRGVKFDQWVLRKSGYRGGLFLTDCGVHSLCYIAYDAYSTTSSSYADTEITPGDKRGELIIKQTVKGDELKTRAQFGGRAEAVMNKFRETRSVFAT